MKSKFVVFFFFPSSNTKWCQSWKWTSPGQRGPKAATTPPPTGQQPNPHPSSPAPCPPRKQKELPSSLPPCPAVERAVDQKAGAGQAELYRRASAHLTSTTPITRPQPAKLRHPCPLPASPPSAPARAHFLLAAVASALPWACTRGFADAAAVQ